MLPIFLVSSNAGILADTALIELLLLTLDSYVMSSVR